jgi:hypothetical protein
VVKIAHFLPGCIVFLFCAGCVSLMEMAGQAIDGSAFKEKTTAVYRARKKDGKALDMEIRAIQNKSGETQTLITLGDFPAFTLRASAPAYSAADQNAAGKFYFISLDYLSGGAAGWNEYTLELSGAGSLALDDASAVLSIPQPPEAVQISKGRIQRYDTRLTGEAALTALRNRRERMIALAEWLKAREAPEQNGAVDFKAGLKNFEKKWKPVLFPELAAAGKRPALWRQAGDTSVRAEEVNWNASYTERAFPEELRPIRDSGTMLRDWEEALPWLYLEYEWEDIFSRLAGEITLNSKKHK